MTTFRFQLRRGTAVEWATANPVLSAGEPGFDLDTGEQRIGDGVTAWSDLPIIGDLTPALDAVAAEAAARGAALGGKVDKGAILLSINDYANTPTAIASVLDQALTDGATTKRVVILGPGVWSSAKAGRHAIKSYTGLAGDPSGGTTLRFTHASGGINIADTAGTSGQHVYGVKIRDLLLDGQGVVPKIVTGNRVEEMDLSNVRLAGWTDAALELTDASLVTSRRLEFSGTDATLTLPAIRLAGGTGSLELASPNFFKCSGIELSGPSLTDLRLTGQPWVEECRDLFTINHPGSAVSVGRVEITGRVISTTTTCRLVRTVAAGSGTINASVIDLRDLNITAGAATTPLLDMSAFANAGNVLLRFRESKLSLSAFTGQLLTVNASQAWNLMHAEFADLWGATPGGLYSTARWFPTAGFATGGSFARPLILKGSGTPEGVFTAPVGSLYQRIDLGAGSLYRKISGFGNTGWQPIDTYGPIRTVIANYTLTYDDSVLIANGTSLSITLPTPANYTGRRFTIKNINPTTATVVATVDGVASPTLATNERMTVVTDGAAWRRID